MATIQNSQKLPKDLRSLVSQSVALLGQVIRKRAGNVVFNKVERIREEMKGLRGSSEEATSGLLSRLHQRLKTAPAAERQQIAHSFSLMLELINCSETAYRTYRLRDRTQRKTDRLPESITYVVTAHPTEARPPQMIALFQEVQVLLIRALQSGFPAIEQDLEHTLQLIWSLPLSRHEKPTVEDEAESVFAIILRPRSILGYIELHDRNVPFQIRSWIGGDKDGHPGVTASVNKKCLSLSRARLIDFVCDHLQQVEEKLAIARSALRDKSIESLFDDTRSIQADFQQRRKIIDSDGVSVVQLRKAFERYCGIYEAKMGVLPSALQNILKLFKLFPALVVPLELRDSADVIAQSVELGKETQIAKIVESLRKICKGAEATWYVAGIVVSHTETAQDLIRAAQLQKKHFKNLPIPVIPLFESESALVNSAEIVRQILKYSAIKNAIKRNWQNKLEVMVGYSDSAKQSGSLPSRLMISKSIHAVSKALEEANVTPVFFHGSGGSVARGGGSLQEQTEWWPKAAISIFKMTVQGEMIQRSFASREILNRQIEKISGNLKIARTSNKQSEKLDRFTNEVKQAYRGKIENPDFLDMVAKATPYRFLKDLKIGSRPSKRGREITFASLRAIPWVLCWTQTRTLFPAWWGIGSAWQSRNADEKNELKKFYETSSLFRSYIKLLGFTLSKVELPVFEFYLKHSDLSESQVAETMTEFKRELKNAMSCVRYLTGHRDLMWFRPWLKESIHYRSSMIHPLNILQIIAIENEESELLRETVTGVASGMLTTG